MKKFLQLRYWNERFGRLPVVLALSLLALLVLWGMYFVGVYHANYLKETVSEQREQLKQRYQDIQRMEYQRNVLQVELDIEKSANKELQKELSNAQEDNYDLRKKVAFYQKIMAPEMQQSGVVIESLAISNNAAERHFHFSLALLQIEQRRKFVKGNIDLRLVGRKNGKETSYDLLKLAGIDSADQAFVMRYFSLFEGDFLLPEDFVPERVDVVATITKGAEGRLERTFYWGESLRSENNT